MARDNIRIGPDRHPSAECAQSLAPDLQSTASRPPHFPRPDQCRRPASPVRAAERVLRAARPGDRLPNYIEPVCTRESWFHTPAWNWAGKLPAGLRVERPSMQAPVIVQFHMTVLIVPLEDRAVRLFPSPSEPTTGHSGFRSRLKCLWEAG